MAEKEKFLALKWIITEHIFLLMNQVL